MIITCERCRTSFRIDDSKIEITGTRVRCSRCGSEFIAKREDKPEEEALKFRPETKEHVEQVEQEDKGISEEKFPEVESRLEDTRTPNEDELSLFSPSNEERETEEEFEEEHLESEGETEKVVDSLLKPMGFGEEQPEGKAPGMAEQEEEEFEWDYSGSKESFEKLVQPTEDISEEVEEPEESSEDEESSEMFVQPTKDEEDPSTGEDISKESEEFSEDKGLGGAESGLDESEETAYQMGKDLREIELRPLVEEDLSQEPYAQKEEKEEDISLEYIERKGLETEDFPQESAETPQNIPQRIEEPLGQEEETPEKFPGLDLLVDIEETKPQKRVVSFREMREEREARAGDIRLRTRQKGGFLKRVVSRLFLLVVLVAILAMVGTIAVYSGLIPKEKVEKIEVLFSLFNEGLNPTKLIVSDYSERWVDTQVGPLFVVSGNVTNRSEYPVSHIRVKGEFFKGGKKISEQIVYCGNILKDEDFVRLSLGDIFKKLDKISGDVDFKNVQSLEGLNVRIEPNESVPFYIVLPSMDKPVNINYRASVVGFEKNI